MPVENRKWRGFRISPLFFAQFFVFIAAWIIAITNQNYFPQNTKSMHFGVDAQTAKHLALGYDSVVGDLMWIRLLPEIDYKESSHVVNGWAFHMLDDVTTLEPRFDMPYTVGATILSVVVHDAEGAATIFERGVKQFPDNWPLAYEAGFHFLFFAKDCNKAAKYLSMAEAHGAPPWVGALSGRLYLKSGQYQLARIAILDALTRAPEGSRYHNHLVSRLKELDDAYKNSSSKKTLIEGLHCDAPAT